MIKKLSTLDLWELSLGVFFPREKVFKVEKITVRLIVFKGKINNMGTLESIIMDEPSAAEGFLWVDNGLNKNVPCVIYRAKNMNRYHRDPNESDFNYVINEAVTDARYAKSDSVVVFRSMFDKELYGWIIADKGIELLNDNEPVTFSYDNFISKNK